MVVCVPEPGAVAVGVQALGGMLDQCLCSLTSLFVGGLKPSRAVCVRHGIIIMWCRTFVFYKSKERNIVVLWKFVHKSGRFGKLHLCLLCSPLRSQRKQIICQILQYKRDNLLGRLMTRKHGVIGDVCNQEKCHIYKICEKDHGRHFVIQFTDIKKAKENKTEILNC